MFCRKCGTETSDDSQFCRKCGVSVNTGFAVSSSGAAAAPARIAEKTKSKRVAIWFLLPILALVVWWAATSNSPGAQQFRHVTQQQRVTTISNPDLGVSPNGYASFKFDVPAGATSVHLQGGFFAKGGSGNDVEVFLLPEQDFLNWQNGHRAVTLYNSGKVTTGTINVNLPSDAGTYYLVFSNKFSLVSPKSVNVNTKMTFYQ